MANVLKQANLSKGTRSQVGFIISPAAHLQSEYLSRVQYNSHNIKEANTRVIILTPSAPRFAGRSSPEGLSR